jgi:hypothetical protein
VSFVHFSTASNEKTGKLVWVMSNGQSQILWMEGTIKKKLTSEQLLILEIPKRANPNYKKE